MNIQLYDKLTLLCMAAAVTSAVLFDKIEPYSWVAAVLGIASASASLLMYLFLRDRETDQEFSDTETGIREVALSDHLSRASGLVSVAALPNAYGGSHDADARLEDSQADSPETIVTPTGVASSKRQVALDIRESMHIVEFGRSARIAWMIMEIGHAGEPLVRVHVKRQKKTFFASPEESGFGRVFWDPRWIEAFTTGEQTQLSRGFAKASRRQNPSALSEASLVLPGPKERLYH